MVFKGAGGRDARGIAEAMEDVGGQLNAWTGRDATAFHARVLEPALPLALDLIAELRREFWRTVKVPGSAATLNQSLEKAGRVADFLELGELMCLDALHRYESCGGHFRGESQTDEGEAQRDDENFSYAAAWEFTGVGESPVLHKEDLVFDYVTPSQRSYK